MRLESTALLPREPEMDRTFCDIPEFFCPKNELMRVYEARIRTLEDQKRLLEEITKKDFVAYLSQLRRYVERKEHQSLRRRVSTLSKSLEEMKKQFDTHLSQCGFIMISDDRMREIEDSLWHKIGRNREVREEVRDIASHREYNELIFLISLERLNYELRKMIIKAGVELDREFPEIPIQVDVTLEKG